MRLSARRLVAVLVLCVPRPVSACMVGDPSRAPQIAITESPPDCCHGDWAGSVTGTVSNVDTDSVVVVIYAQTDLYYVQPFVDRTTPVTCGGFFSSATHGGRTYCAVLARSGWQPPATLGSLPPVGGDVLAVTCAPDEQRRLEFAGRTWTVKSTGTVPFGPGGNLWSDSPENVWVDGQGRLHLRITEREGVWYAAEVFTEGYIGYGRYRFEVEGAVDALDPNVVFAGFFYSDQGDEADIEFSRWGDASSPTNAQFVVQPDAVHAVALELPGAHSTHEFTWRPDRIDFASWQDGSLQTPVAAWSCAQAPPQPDVERMHFNLWLLGGGPPADLDEVEVVVSSFQYDLPTDATSVVGGNSRAALVTNAPVGSTLRYALRLLQPARVRVRLFDSRGRVVHHLLNTHLAAGSHHYEWAPAALRVASGVYFLHLETPDTQQSARVILLR